MTDVQQSPDISTDLVPYGSTVASNLVATDAHQLAASSSSFAEEPIIAPPDDDEVWSYVADDGKRFLQFSAFSRICLGSALVFLALHGSWLLLLLPFAVGIVAGGFVNMIWSTQVPAFDRSVHMFRQAMLSTAPPSVDVFICTCGEDPSIVENTIRHAMDLDYPGSVAVHVLDDRHAEEVRLAAERWGANYIARPNRGWMKKAGNLHFGFSRTEGELIIVLDADFAVRPDFLRHTVPYFDDGELAILQTPQFFRVSEDNWVERGAAAQQEQFYRIGMRARDKHGGAICVGTNAVYRRAALDETGGMALLEHSEDIFTGMKVIEAGYRVDYLPLPLAAGSAPDTTKALASQQYRWARGNFALAGTPMFKRMRLRPMQRLGLWDGWIFYVTSALSPIIAIFVPVVSLAEAPWLITLAPAAMILPSLFTEFYLQPRWLHLPDGRASRRVGLISQLAHLYALRDHLTDRDQEWIPTGGQRPSEKQGTDRIPDQITAGATFGFLLIMGLLLYRLGTGWAFIDLAPVGLLAAIALPAALGTTKPPVDLAIPVEASAPAIGSGRDAFLDVVRSISIVRVMFWHAFGYWWISWTFAAMPAVFYVSGAVLAKSLRSRGVDAAGVRAVMRGRLRRLVPPYLAFVAIAIAIVTLGAPAVWTDEPLNALSWFVPFRAPASLPWEEGWLSAPLWFLRALVIILAITPLVRPLGRKIPGIAQFVTWAAALVILDHWVDQQTTEQATAIARGVADVICFGGFFTLGVSGHHLRGAMARRHRLAITITLGATAVIWAVTQRPGDLVVNNSYVLFGLVGLAWLFALLTIEDHLRHLGEIPAIAAFVGWITNNAMTIYLWHTLALVFAYYVVGAPDSLASYVLLAAVFAAILAPLVAAVRPLESVGSGQKTRRPPVRVARIVLLAFIIGMAASQPRLFPEFTEAAGPPTPSGRPPVGGDETGPDSASPEELALMAESAEAWLAGHDVEAVAVVEIGSETGDRPVVAEFGTPDVLDPDAPFEALSLTKTMVAAVSLQLIDEGSLTLDGPLPDVPGVPTEVTEQLSMRRLLSHATGLADYRWSGDFSEDAILTPADAIELGLVTSNLESTTPSYAATNYLLAGLVIEAVTGQPLSEVLAERLFEPLELNDTELVNNQRAGFIGHGSAGVVSTLDDLARWYDALLRSDRVLDARQREMLLYGGIVFQGNAGLGTWRHCPCNGPTPAEPEPFLYAFHDGGDARLVYIPSRDVVLAIRLSKPLYDEDQIAGDMSDLIFAIADRRR